MVGHNCFTLSDIEFYWNDKQSSLLNIDSLTMNRGEKLFVHGPSGCGKSTLLNLITGILKPKSGEINVLGNNLFSLTQKNRDQFRVDHMGIIFQQFNLIPYLNVFENISLPCEFSYRRKEMLTVQKCNLFEESLRLLSSLGLKDEKIISQNVTELSTGQQQRVAAARALIGSPEIIIADEPTSALDQDTKQGFLELLFDEAKRCNSAILFVSHDLTLSKSFDRSVSFDEINHS
ncbi:MAG: ABC transporter ATP-binding protein [Gammaproteobacteria bacterium]